MRPLACALLAVLLPSALMAPGTCPVIPDNWGTLWRPEPVERGIASYYADWHHGKTMANGQPFDMYAMTAASRTLPLGTVCEVIHRATGRAVVVVIQDRGPYVGNRIIDLSYAAACALEMVPDGLAEVAVYRAK